MSWSLRSPRVVGLALLLAVVPLSVQAGTASPDPTPTDSPVAPATSADSADSADSAGEAARSALFEDMPEQLGGFEPVIEIIHGEEHFANLQPDDSGDEETARRLEHLLEVTGAEVGDMTSGYTLVSVDDFFAFVFALRIEGASEDTLLSAYLPTLLADLVDPSAVERQVAGRPVVVITSEGSGAEPALLHVHATHDTVWVLQGPDDVVQTVLSELPQRNDSGCATLP